MKAKYLIRFDDCCTTMNWKVWSKVERILLEFDIKPILSIVPDNQDKSLKVAEENSNFWNEVRVWKSRDWTIGMHGYQHLYVTQKGGILGINKFSEFSGLPYEIQEKKLRCALAIFERQGVLPDVWVAPAHSFDLVTLRILNQLGVHSVSDGFSLFPHIDSCGLTWVPQQLWSFRHMPWGVWTVCCHMNSWKASEIARFRANVEQFKPFLTDFLSVSSAYNQRQRSCIDRLFGIARMGLLKTPRRQVLQQAL